MDGFIDFMRALCYITGGVFCIIFWVAVIMIVAIEIHDAIFGVPSNDNEKEGNHG